MTAVVVAVLLLAAAAAAIFPIVRWWSDRERYAPAKELPPLIIPFRTAGDGSTEPIPAIASRVATVVEIPTEQEVRVERVGRADEPVRAVRLVKDDVDERLAAHETIRFRRPVEEPVQLLPGRLEVVSGDAIHREIRFVRIPGEPMQLILGREGGPSPQYVALRADAEHLARAHQQGRVHSLYG